MHEVIQWILGFNDKEIKELINEKVTFRAFFNQTKLNQNADLIKWNICSYRIEEIENLLTRRVRYLNKLVDVLAT